MAIYTTSAFSDPPIAHPTMGVIVNRIQHTLTAALAAGTNDYLRVCKLPKGACIVPELCAVFADADPDAGNNATVSLTITDGTTTKTIIATANLQAADTRLTPAAAEITGLGFFKTSNDDFAVHLNAVANDVDAAAVLYIVVAYTMVGGRSEVIV